MWKQIAASRWFYIVALAVMLGAFFASQVEIESNPRPLGDVGDIRNLAKRDDLNIVFILIDTLRADRLSAYGYARPTSPSIDALAADGVRFAKHMSQSSWTKCSMASMWTATYPIRTGVLRSPDAISSEARMPAEILKQAGYRTYALFRNAWVGPDFGFSQGFDVYHSPRPGQIPRSVRREKPTIGVVGTDQDTLRSALEFLRTHGQEKFFLYLHLMDVHQYVYDETTALFGTRYTDIYDNAIRWVDRIVGSLVSDIDRRGLRDKTLIVLAADHGEAFGEHGREGHARDVYGEVTTTPLVISFPFRLESGVVVDAPTENVDLWPTLLDLLELPPLEETDGRSRLEDLYAAAEKHPTVTPPHPRFAHIDQTWGRTGVDPNPMVAVYDGHYRLDYRPKARGARRAELYDMATDRYEAKNITAENSEIAKKLVSRAQAYLERPLPKWGSSAPQVELEESKLQQLRALGYDVK